MVSLEDENMDNFKRNIAAFDGRRQRQACVTLDKEAGVRTDLISLSHAGVKFSLNLFKNESRINYLE